MKIIKNAVIVLTLVSLVLTIMSHPSIAMRNVSASKEEKANTENDPWQILDVRLKELNPKFCSIDDLAKELNSKKLVITNITRAFPSLSDEIVMDILQTLDLYSLEHVARVSKYLYVLCDDPNLWIFMLQKIGMQPGNHPKVQCLLFRDDVRFVEAFIEKPSQERSTIFINMLSSREEAKQAMLTKLNYSVEAGATLSQVEQQFGLGMVSTDEVKKARKFYKESKENFEIAQKKFIKLRSRHDLLWQATKLTLPIQRRQ